LLHVEDFGPGNARRILQAYGDKYRIFNDDMLGTGAITLAATLSAVKVTGVPMREQKLVVFGAGTTGVGIADQIHDAMVRDGASPEQARSQVWLVDKQGLLTGDMPDLRDYQQPYAREPAEVKGWAVGSGPITLLDALRHVKPTILLGTSTAHGAFTQEVIETMSAGVGTADRVPDLQPDLADRGHARRRDRLVRRPGAGRGRHPGASGGLPGGDLPDRAGQQRAATRAWAWAPSWSACPR
jgi:malate dehydrogenase (oxaloacetate-decarboxylating)